MRLFSSQAIPLPQTRISPDHRNHGPIIFQRSYWEQGFTQLSNLKLVRWLQELYENNIGLLLIAASQLFMTFMNVTVKFLNQIDDPVPTLELILVRMLITYCCSVTYMLVAKVPHPMLGPPEVRYLLVVRGVSGFFGIFGVYYSLKYLSLSDAIILTFLAPTTTSIAGFLFLHETLSRKEVFAGLFSLFGVVLIARPQSLFGKHSEGGQDLTTTITVTPTQRLIAVGVAMIGVVGATGAYVSIRAIGKRANALHSMTYFSSFSSIASIIGMILFNVKPVIPTQWLWCGLLLLIGIWGFVGQVLLTMGLQRETASRGTLALYIQIIFATSLDRIIFSVIPSYLSVLGAFIIMGSAIYIVANKDTKSGVYELIPQNTDDSESQHPVDDSTELSLLGQESSNIAKGKREADLEQEALKPSLPPSIAEAVDSRGVRTSDSK